VVLLLFVLGLSLNFGYLRKIGKIALSTGIGQLVFTATVGMLILMLFDFSFVAAIYLAVAMTFSSTIVIIKLLTDKGDTEAFYGQHAIGLMLVQDVVAIVLLLLIPMFSGQTMVWNMLLMWVLKAFVLFAVIYALARFVLKTLLDRIAKSTEFLFIFTIAWCFGVAGLAHWGGFSVEIGALMAGISLGATPYHFEISSRIKPLRDFFIMVFFIILGAQMNLGDLKAVIVPGIVMTLFVLVGNPIILYLLYRLNHVTRRNSFLISICAAQVSEFGFILLFVGQSLDHVLPRQIAVYTFVALVTIFISSYLITYNKQLFRLLTPIFNLFGADRQRLKGENDKITDIVYDVWVLGYHRVGWKLCETLKAKNVPFAVVDFNPEASQRLHEHDIPLFFGDIGDVEFLQELPLEKAKMVIMTIPDPHDQIVAIRHIKHVNPQVMVVGLLNHSRYLKDLYSAGADFVLMPHLLTGVWMSDVISHLAWNKKIFAHLRNLQEEEMIQRREVEQEFV
jgi:Kef-type K+ transport system membrane component KefB/Trk K+ transport system NAD-binding subunit